jgi:hypothetical protein
LDYGGRFSKAWLSGGRWLLSEWLLLRETESANTALDSTIRTLYESIPAIVQSIISVKSFSRTSSKVHVEAIGNTPDPGPSAYKQSLVKAATTQPSTNNKVHCWTVVVRVYIIMSGGAHTLNVHAQPGQDIPIKMKEICQIIVSSPLIKFTV